jgi:hypothetical protein
MAQGIRFLVGHLNDFLLREKNNENAGIDRGMEYREIYFGWLDVLSTNIVAHFKFCVNYLSSFQNILNVFVS